MYAVSNNSELKQKMLQAAEKDVSCAVILINSAYMRVRKDFNEEKIKKVFEKWKNHPAFFKKIALTNLEPLKSILAEYIHSVLSKKAS